MFRLNELDWRNVIGWPESESESVHDPIRVVCLTFAWMETLFLFYLGSGDVFFNVQLVQLTVICRCAGRRSIIILIAVVTI